MSRIFAIEGTIIVPSGVDGRQDLVKCPRTHRGSHPCQHRGSISAKNAGHFAEAWRPFQENDEVQLKTIF